MEFRELLRRRRMVRSYGDEPVAREALERIAATVRRAPSAGFSQGQRLLVVTRAETRRAIAEVVAPEWTSWIATAPAHVVVCVSEDDYHRRYRQPDKLRADGSEIEWPVPYWYVDAGAALMLLLLAALDEGLAAGLVGVRAGDMRAFRRLLGIPDDVAVVGVVTVGHEAPDPERELLTSRLTQRRKPLAELVYWERWGGQLAS